MAEKKETANVVVTVGQEHLASLASVAKALKAAGLRGINTMPTLGMITGKVPHAKMADLKDVSGVAAVELDEEMKAT